MSTSNHDEQFRGETDPVAYQKGKALVAALRQFYEEDREAHDDRGETEPFPEYSDWIARERTGSLSTMVAIEKNGVTRFTR